MALPVVAKVWDASNLFKTVVPYLPQLRTLPSQLVQSYNNWEALKAIYITTNPLITALGLSLFLAPIFLVVSEINKNYSQVDRCWSILPTIYNLHYCLWAHLTGLNTQRLDYVAAISIIWSLRLTFNYWRKGGYNIGSEDYRWEILRTKISPPLFFLFNVSFISLGQSILLFLITTPTYIMLLCTLVKGAQPISTADNVWAGLLLVLVLFEFFADQAQWDFYQAREEYRKTAKAPYGYQPRALELGFNCLGLFAYSRHPNFAAEQAIWVGLYQWACWTSDVVFNWTFAGAIGYILLFQASTWFTELVTAGKYPEYKEYQKEVGKFIPKLDSILRQTKSKEVVEAVDGAGAKKEVVAAKNKKNAGIERDQPKRKGSKRL